eukprot:CAMPEP_0119040544 /NCGR_PEP_ID=MMETSP1177-20130426/10507_1 /TAXON_ID=2985 /ORGANISM="Ochromonas sp, Strain CCMP1899" /LENGTH=250 /DNA_ID=CAMNT_0007005699 /DNA_START=361 /DNA_END=1113 /DNA_ORIENTATION=+
MKMKDIIPKEPGDIGIALPPVSNKVLENAIISKKHECFLLLLTGEDEFHSTWYTDGSSLSFDIEIDAWANTVRAKSLELGGKWVYKTGLLASLLIPLLISMVFFSTSNCKPGYYSIPRDQTPWGINTFPRPQCVPCKAGSYSSGGSDLVCAPCAVNTYSNSHAEVCELCPVNSFASVGSSACHCLRGFTWIEDPIIYQIEGQAVSMSLGGKGSCQPEFIEIISEIEGIIEIEVYEKEKNINDFEDWEEDL